MTKEHFLAVVAVGDHTELIGHAPFGDHPPGLVGCHFDVAGGAVGDLVRPEDDFLGGAARTTQDFLGGAPCAKLNGTITNGTGKPVSNASVLTMDVSGHLINVTATGSDGKFTLHALPPGAYTIVVKNSYVTASGETVKATGNDAGAAPSQFVVLSPEDNLRLNTLVD